MLDTFHSPPENQNGIRVGGERHTMNTKAGPIEEGYSLVNYSKLNQLTLQSLKVAISNGNPVLSGDFSKKIVLLGDATLNDVFTVPGPVKPLNGIYLHACAAYTFIKSPLFGFSHPFRIGIDLVLSGMLLLLLSRLNTKSKKHESRHVMLLLLVNVGCLILVRFSGIMWFDFIAISIALWLHPNIEHIIQQRYFKRSRSHPTAPALTNTASKTGGSHDIENDS